MTTVHAFDYLADPAAHPPPPVCVLFGDEPFLKRLARQELRQIVCSGEDVPFATFEGGAAEWRDVHDEVSTVSLFGGGGPRLAVVEEADSFVSQHRERLEDYVAKPKATGVLVLEIQKHAANTRLYKAVHKAGLQIECRPPIKPRGKNLDEPRLASWLSSWSQSRHGTKLPGAAAKLLLEQVGPELGLLDQELAKLALFVGPGESVTPELVRDVSGGWRTTTVWDLVEAACEGNAAEALAQLDRLLQAGEAPLGILPQVAWSLRRYAMATRLAQQAERGRGRPDGNAILERAGFHKWKQGEFQRVSSQLRRLGRTRTGALYRKLLDADLALKGSHSPNHRARLVLERLIVDLAPEAA